MHLKTSFSLAVMRLVLRTMERLTVAEFPS